MDVQILLQIVFFSTFVLSNIYYLRNQSKQHSKILEKLNLEYYKINEIINSLKLEMKELKIEFKREIEKLKKRIENIEQGLNGFYMKNGGEHHDFNEK